MTSYTKLRDGSWGLRINSGQTVTPGQTITVTKKSGDTKQETVGKVLWSGNGVTLATIAQSSGQSSSPRGNQRGTWTGCSCGSVEEFSKHTDCAGCLHDAD